MGLINGVEELFKYNGISVKLETRICGNKDAVARVLHITYHNEQTLQSWKSKCAGLMGITVRNDHLYILSIAYDQKVVVQDEGNLSFILKK